MKLIEYVWDFLAKNNFLSEVIAKDRTIMRKQ